MERALPKLIHTYGELLQFGNFFFFFGHATAFEILVSP